MIAPWTYQAKWNKSDGERKTLYDFTYVWNIKNKQTKQKETHRCREQSSGYHRGRGSWEKWVKGVNSMMMNRNNFWSMHT